MYFSDSDIKNSTMVALKDHNQRPGSLIHAKELAFINAQKALICKKWRQKHKRKVGFKWKQSCTVLPESIIQQTFQMHVSTSLHMYTKEQNSSKTIFEKKGSNHFFNSKKAPPLGVMSSSAVYWITYYLAHTYLSLKQPG